ncbi:putative protein TPRXL [Panicum virgatum]|uniref:putative protein TPRXL n=1 Tax=Panicum virgatum TaxID=38727 RepID=UPI0019D65D95|nr:putative protein TPRXL [Panicum virgatum]
MGIATLLPASTSTSTERAPTQKLNHASSPSAEHSIVSNPNEPLLLRTCSPNLALQCPRKKRAHQGSSSLLFRTSRFDRQQILKAHISAAASSHTLTHTHRITVISDQTTGVSSGLLRTCASRLPSTRSAIAFRVSYVPLPTCGTTTTLSMPNSASGTCGSSSNTSSPAPPSRPSASAATSSASSTCGPRPMLMSTPLGPRASITSRFTMCRVAAFSGQATTRTSLLAASSTTDG